MKNYPSQIIKEKIKVHNYTFGIIIFLHKLTKKKVYGMCVCAWVLKSIEGDWRDT